MTCRCCSNYITRDHVYDETDDAADDAKVEAYEAHLTKKKDKKLRLMKLKASESPYQKSKKSKTITVTYGECAENHVGMQKIGFTAERGLPLEQLQCIQHYFDQLHYTTELAMLSEALPLDVTITKEMRGASILIVRDGVNGLLHKSSLTQLYKEQSGLNQDTKAKMYGRVVNKHARYNLCFDDTGQEPNYEVGMGRIIAFNDVPSTQELKINIEELLKICGTSISLKAEGNYYFDAGSCGIGYHGDSERRIVVAIRLGDDMPLHYIWYHGGERISDKISFLLRHGDIYFMSEKAVGTDWKSPSKYTLRHAAGCEKFTA